MKPKEYIKKYNLSSGQKFNHSEFIGDLTIDFMSMLELGRKDDGSFNIKGFENSVTAIRQKWDGIHLKTVPGLPDKLWRYFYATVIVKTRDSMFPDIMAMRKKKKEDYHKRQEEYKKMQEEEQEAFNKAFFGDWEKFLFDNILKSMYTMAPKTEFSELGIPETSTEDDVKKAYKKLVMIHHPDKGGKEENFRKITDAKNKCLAYLANK